jgi:glycolate oxidase FAD binding subunit
MDLTAFASDVGTEGPVTITGLGTRGGPVDGARVVHAPSGIDWIAPEEMTVSCGAGTPVDELDAALAERNQRVSLPAGGTVGGALAVGHGSLLRLGLGPVRDALLQTRVVTAEGVVAKAGGPTVKNVSGFDLCRLLVGSQGTLAFLGDVILRTRPRPAVSIWVAGEGDPFALRSRLHAAMAILWDGTTTWACLEGHPDDVAAQGALSGLAPVDGPPAVPAGGRRSVPAAALRDLRGRFVAEVGVGVVHLYEAAAPPAVDPAVAALHRRLKQSFDPTGRLNAGRSAVTGTVTGS